MKNENSRNTIIFIVASALILGLYWFTVLRPQAEVRRANQPAAAEQQSEAAADASNTALRPESAIFVTNRTQALGAGARVPIQTPTLRGSLSLQGGRIDDLFLVRYRETLDADSPPVELFRPQGMEHAYFAQFGWTGPNVAGGVPGPNTPWSLTAGSTLTPTSPVTLTWDNGQGLRFTRVISIDDQYMFTVADTVQNLGTQPITIAPYGSVQRQGVPADLGKQMILHEGAIGVFGQPGRYATDQYKYKDWQGKARIQETSTGGWLGITDKYWMAALIPPQTEQVSAEFRVRDPEGANQHEANVLGASRTIQPGASVTETQRLFAGAKRNEILKGYEQDLNLPRFVYAIDWGMFWFLTRPIFMVVEFFFQLLGNFGLAILALTVLVKLLLFPLANKSYESMSKMRNLQPKMEEIKKKFGSDPQKQQQETMALYQREKINPVAGCLPILVQIPIFFALYKVLFVTIEMRHQPFFGWIRDLSARDHSTIWNLFGLLPYDPAAVPLIGAVLNGPAHIGLLPILYGVTMWLQQAMNPAVPDPMQRRIFALMPVVLAFVLAPSPAGVLIYWVWSTILSILQQYIIMHRFGAENPIDSFIARMKKTPKARVTDFSEDELEQARVLFQRPATFVMGAAKIEQLPDPDLPEVAFAGRSNVGKSSLINGLVGMHKLARASNEPGRTREVNFFDLDGRLRLVDLPGYGFAKASKAATRKFQDLGRDYLRGRVTLKRVYLLIDSRHGLKSVDGEALDALDLAAVSYQIILTKADKLKKGEGEAVAAATLKAIAKRPAAFPAVILTSSEKGDGLSELRAEIMRTTGAALN